MDTESMDQVNDGLVTILRLLKGALVLMLTIGAKLTQLQQSLGNDKFAEFVRTRLPCDLAEAQLFMRLAQMPGLDAARFTPPVAVAMPRLLEVMGQIVGMLATINDGTAPENDAGTAVASAPAPGPDCEASAEAPVIDNDAQAGTNDTTIVGTTLITTSETPAVIDDVALPDVPAGNDHAADQEAAGEAITDNLTGITAPAEHADARANGAPAAADEPPAHGPELTAEQRQYLRDRSVTLLVKVNRGELTVETAMRQAANMPKRRTK